MSPPRTPTGRAGAAGPAVTVLCRWDRTAAPTGLLGPRERAIAEAMPAWRRAEFTRGRLCAHAALRLVLGEVPDGLEILRDADGTPRPTAAAPIRFRLSLSHTDGYVACAVAPAGGPVGVDVENLDEANEILRRRMTGPADAVGTGIDPTLLFSCKEAALKAAPPPARALAAYPVRSAPGRWPDTLTVGSARWPAWPVLLPGAVLVTVTGRPGPPVLLRRDPDSLFALLETQGR